MTSEEYYNELRRRVASVLESRSEAFNHIHPYPWLIGALGDPFSGVWFVAENPSLTMVERATNPGGGQAAWLYTFLKGSNFDVINDIHRIRQWRSAIEDVGNDPANWSGGCVAMDFLLLYEGPTNSFTYSWLGDFDLYAPLINALIEEFRTD